MRCWCSPVAGLRLNWISLAGRMRKPAWVFDARAITDREQVSGGSQPLVRGWRGLMARTVLVTGAAGFIGAALSQRLLQRGDRVVGLDNQMTIPTPASNRRGCVRSKPWLSPEPGGLSAWLWRMARPCWHCSPAVSVTPWRIRLYIQSNLVGFNLLEGCRHYGTENLVYASNGSVYGGNRNFMNSR